MVKKIIILIVLCILHYCGLYAQVVPQEIALRVAENFLQLQSSADSRMSLQLLGDIEQPSMYIYSSLDRWVLIAGDYRVQPILAYSDENSSAFSQEEDMPPAMTELLDWYSSQIQVLRNDRTYTDIHPLWNAYLNHRLGSIPSRTIIVDKLLVRNGNENKWRQSGNNGGTDVTRSYNKFCPPAWNPSTLDSCSHSKVGCSALATAQVMWYWQWPYATVVNSGESNQQIARYYDWDSIPYRLTDSSGIEEANMTANLLHDVGVEENMNYGCTGSGASVDEIVSALYYTFDYYVNDVQKRSSYANDIWIGMIKNELDNLRPVIYSGHNTSDGHAFVIDGYDSANRFHINFGWAGNYNGYYSLDSIYYDFTLKQKMITGIYPHYFNCSPFIIPTYYTWPETFTVVNGGGLEIGNRIITSGMKGVIVSGESVKLTSGFKIEVGANVNIIVEDMPCYDEREASVSSENTRAFRSSPQCTYIVTPPSTTKILHEGQILILRGDKTYTIQGQEVQ